MSAAGVLFGATVRGGDGVGTVFELERSGDGWKERALHRFTGENNNDGMYPEAGVVLDQQGNLYGTTVYGGRDYGCGCGAVYEITP